MYGEGAAFYFVLEMFYNGDGSSEIGKKGTGTAIVAAPGIYRFYLKPLQLPFLNKRVAVLTTMALDLVISFDSNGTRCWQQGVYVMQLVQERQ